MTKLKILVDTFLKQQTGQAAQLPDSQKKRVTAGSVFEITAYNPAEANHFKVTLKDTLNGSNTWYVFQKNGIVLDNGGNMIYPTEVKLLVPYKSQLDNTENPYGSCNVTSISMCLAYFGVKDNPDQQLEDEMQDWLESQGLDRHDPGALATAVEHYGHKDTFKTDASIKEVKEWLVQGNPAVVHGYFTASGHVICFTGFNDKGFIVNDPYGEWFAEGYDTSRTGEGLTYSYNMIQETCLSDGQFWVHFISR